MFTSSKAGNEGVGGGNARLGLEQADFPVVCETCLGSDPYVRMQKDHSAESCKFCERAFTVFRWRPGKGQKIRCTVVCQSCARLKNLCQSCLLDLKYGLPSQIRDSIMDKASAGIGGVRAPHNPDQQHYHQQQQLALLDAGVTPEGPDLVDVMRSAMADRESSKRRGDQGYKGDNDSKRSKHIALENKVASQEALPRNHLNMPPPVGNEEKDSTTKVDSNTTAIGGTGAPPAIPAGFKAFVPPVPGTKKPSPPVPSVPDTTAPIPVTEPTHRNPPVKFIPPRPPGPIPEWAWRPVKRA
jgi:hypothetical protein